MTLDNLIGKLLEQINPDPVAIQRLLEAAQRNITDAELVALSNENRFDVAYKAIMQLANASVAGWCDSGIFHGFVVGLVGRLARRFPVSGERESAGRCGAAGVVFGEYPRHRSLGVECAEQNVRDPDGSGIVARSPQFRLGLLISKLTSQHGRLVSF